jgi:hypothetical protein
MSWKGLHCPGCGNGGGGAAGVLVVLAVAVVIIARSARAIEHAAEVALEVLAITAGSVIGLAVVGADA